MDGPRIRRSIRILMADAWRRSGRAQKYNGVGLEALGLRDLYPSFRAAL